MTGPTVASCQGRLRPPLIPPSATVQRAAHLTVAAWRSASWPSGHKAAQRHVDALNMKLGVQFDTFDHLHATLLPIQPDQAGIF